MKRFLMLLTLLTFLLARVYSAEAVHGRTRRGRRRYHSFLRNSSNECYYLDEFMPAPDSLVSGESGGMKLRYYTYLKAQYKEWRSYTILLSFYSLDRKCWSLFEEAYQEIPKS